MCVKLLLLSSLFFVMGWHDPQLADHVRIPVSLTLKNHIKIDRPIVYLSDIALCKSYDEVCDESYGIEISRLKHPDDRVRISLRDIEKILNIEWPQAIVEFSGNAMTVSVSGVGVIPEKKDLIVLLNKHLPRSEKSQFHVEYINATKKIWKNDSFNITLESGWWEHYVLSPRNLILQTSSKQKFSIRVRLKKKCLSFMTKENMKNGDEVHPHQFKKEWVRCETDLVQEFPKKVVLKNTLMQGRSLKYRHLISLYALKRGDRKKVTFQMGSLTLESFLIAQEKGSPGETIRFKNMKTRKTVYGKILSDGHVEIL
ncbi:MAG: flagellar basal body P-ring formation chaperone FlgA [Oligoflexales bacterium]